MSLVVDDRTANRNYPEPSIENDFETDAARIRTALTMIDTDVAALISDVAGAAPVDSPGFTGTPTAPTPTAGDDSNNVSTTAFVKAAITVAVNALASVYAKLASPTFTGTPTAPTPPNSDNSTRISTTAWVFSNFLAKAGGTLAGALNLNGNAITNLLSSNGGPIGPGFRNKIINPDFDIWQRNTSFTSSGYGADRWITGNTGSTKTFSRQAFTLGQPDVPGNPAFFCRTVVTSVAGSVNTVNLQHRVENANVHSGKQYTLTFYAKADSAKNIAFDFQQNFGTGGSPSATVFGIGVTTCALTSTWKKFSTLVTIPSVSGKTFGTNNDNYMGLTIFFDAGSSLNSRTNSLGQQSGTFDIAHMSLVEGDATMENDPISARNFGKELALCQRYYSAFVASQTSYTVAGANVATQLVWPTTMRAVPTVAIVGGTSQNAASTTTDSAATYGARWLITATATGSVGIGGATITADAEL